MWLLLQGDYRYKFPCEHFLPVIRDFDYLILSWNPFTRDRDMLEVFPCNIHSLDKYVHVISVLSDWRASRNILLYIPKIYQELDVPPLFSFNMQTSMRFWLQQLLYREDRRCKKELLWSKSHVSLYGKARQRKHIWWFQKHKIEPKYV